MLDLEPIQARHKATTQGEWQAVCIGSEGYTLRVSAGQTMRENYEALGFSGRIGEVRGGRDWKELRANAEFLGHAHEDVGKMSAEIERLREGLGSLIKQSERAVLPKIQSHDEDGREFPSNWMESLVVSMGNIARNLLQGGD